MLGMEDPPLNPSIRVHTSSTPFAGMLYTDPMPSPNSWSWHPGSSKMLMRGHDGRWSRLTDVSGDPT